MAIFLLECSLSPSYVSPQTDYIIIIAELQIKPK